MDNFTRTSSALQELQDTYHVPDKFLWDLTGYSTQLLKEARSSFIEFIGSTMGKLDDALEFCRRAEQDQNVTVDPAEFIAKHCILRNGETGKYYTTVWARLATGDMTWEEALRMAKFTDHVVTVDELTEQEGELDEDMRLARQLKSRKRGIAAAEGNYTPIPLVPAYLAHQEP